MISVNNKILQFNNKLLSSSSQPGPSPLPPRTFRFKANRAVSLSDFNYPQHISTLNLVDDTNHIYDVTLSDDDASSLFVVSMFDWLVEILNANTSTITNMKSMFYGCTELTSVALFDTSSVTNMNTMFYHCDKLTTVPTFNTSSVIDMQAMFRFCISLISVPLLNTNSVIDASGVFDGCRNVESGALALYQQVSMQTNIPIHTWMFSSCGIDTATGAAELAQIPDDWK